jgi:hypothetical protein
MKPRKLKNVRVPNRGLLSSGDRSHRKKNTNENSNLGESETPRETTTSEKLKASQMKKHAIELEDEVFREHVR